MKGTAFCIGCLAILLLPKAANAYLTVTRGTVARRSAGPAALSGITYAGGATCYVIADNGEECGLYKAIVNLGSDGLSVSGYSVGSRVPLAMVSDIEGVAYDPASGNVWVSDEATQTITEFDPASGAALRRVDVPAVMKQIVGNYGFESLTISGDGLAMWTANEEALTVDGARSSYSSGTTVRLVKFTRTTVRDGWTLSAMYAYTTERWHEQGSFDGRGRRGVSDLCALPDGSLLVLERELSASSGILFDDPRFFCSIYQITPEAMAAATDIKGPEFDVGLRNVSGWKAVDKGEKGLGHWLYDNISYTGHEDEAWSNFEGLCLGPRIASGATSLLMVTDAGDGFSDAQIVPFAMTGLSIRTLSFASPPAGIPSCAGSNYRFLDNAAVNLSLAGMTASSYVPDGSLRHTCAGWTATGQTPSSGTGAEASFVVSADGEFSWNVKTETVSSGYRIADSFEGFAAGTTVGDLDGWSGGNCPVVEQTYAPAEPPGYVMTREPHTRILDAGVDDADRELPSGMSGDDRLDMMVRVRRSASALKPSSADAQIEIAADPQGRLCLWHAYPKEDGLAQGWIPLSETTHADGVWVRLGIAFDYGSNPDGYAFAKVTVDGSCRPTAHGVRSPTDTRSYGPWHYLARNKGLGGVVRPEGIRFRGTAVDDLMLSKKSVEPEHTGATAVDGIDFAWFDAMGLPRNPNASAPFISGYTLGDVHDAGVDPYSDRPLEVIGFAVEADGKAHVEFNGYRGDSPLVYRILRADSPAFGPDETETISLLDGTFTGDAQKRSTIWTGTVPADVSGGFYRVRGERGVK